MSVGVERTALGPTLIVAVDQYDHPPLVPDPWATQILPRRWRALTTLARLNAVRRSMIAGTEKSVHGGWASLLCRKRYIDDLLRDAVTRGLDAVVILGAGYDTRAYRVSEIAGVRIWEADLPANIVIKSESLRRCFGAIPDNVTLVPIDLATDDVLERLTDNGFDVGMRTFFVWESVTMYLPEAVVRRTLRSMGGSAAGSGLAFTHFRKDFVDGTVLYGADRAHQKFAVREGLWKFGVNPTEVNSLLAEYGWQVLEQMGPAEYRERYLAPTGRSEPVSEIERAVWAGR
ncbi:SAM-dependent methyltransferase [Mycolicibacterium setense]|uniref:SAM-dependent methyltransferase n=1 Tax=Mycolicibacterium setense TaxID=431269 RepID=UPI000573F7D1|nr:SAM-dependent methyltransferase [Mycolicibacterium setense]KHO23153.1 methyltransferase [Mycolicibacterium setense]MCV7115333.1 SAM-dependent methyltransferase [Mycolicibacterium setense]